MEDCFEDLRGASGRGPHSRLSTHRAKAISPTRAKGIPDAIAGLDLAIDALYSHTDFYKMGRKFYHRTIEGNLKPEQEENYVSLGKVVSFLPRRKIENQQNLEGLKHWR